MNKYLFLHRIMYVRCYLNFTSLIVKLKKKVPELCNIRSKLLNVVNILFD
jgi:hypothetical protein